MTLQELLPKLARFTRIIVTGPQRSGTTIATKILANELGFEYLREEAFHVHRLELLCNIILSKDRFVVQAPTMSGCCHYLSGVAIVFMRRDLDAIAASENRVGWNRREFEKTKYFDSSDRTSAEVKYHAWDRFQKRLLRHRAFDLQYESLKKYPLWVTQEQRKDFGLRQIEPTP
jgi:hypothetical protein